MPLPSPLITRSSEVMSGAAVFAGTRVPVAALMDDLQEGSTLQDFLEDFPTVSREHAVAVLELAKEAILVKEAGKIPQSTTKVEASRASLAAVIRQERIDRVLSNQGQIPLDLDQEALARLREAG